MDKINYFRLLKAIGIVVGVFAFVSLLMRFPIIFLFILIGILILGVYIALEERDLRKNRPSGGGKSGL